MVVRVTSRLPATDALDTTSSGKEDTLRWIYPILATFAVLFAVAPANAQDAAAALDVPAIMEDRILGDPDAPVTIIAYESLTCPHCAAFHRDTYDDLVARYVDTGQAKFIYREFPLDQNAVVAAALARCTPEPQFYGMIEVLFRSQGQWSRADDLLGSLGQIGRLSGIGDDAFQACVDNEDLVNAIIQSRQDASLAGVGSTPTFDINGQLYPGARSIDEFASIIDPLLDQ